MTPRIRILLFIAVAILVPVICFAIQTPQAPLPGWQAVNLATLTHWAALYVLYSSMLVNFLAGVELLLKTIEDWANDNLFGNFAAKVKKIEFYIAAATDLIDRIGAINFKDKIRPTRRDKRASDPSPSVVEAKDTAARAAGI